MIKEVTVKTVLNDNFEIESRIGEHLIYADQPKKGQQSKGPSPVEYLLFSIASCYATLIRIISKQKGIKIKNLSIKASGQLDTDRLLGKATAKRAGFETIKIKIIFDENEDESRRLELIKEIEERCPVSDNIINKTKIKFE